MLTIKHLNIHNTKNGFSFVNNLTISLNPGDKCAIIGEEGTGKSTLLKRVMDPNMVSYATVKGHVETKGKIGYLEQDIKARWQDETIEKYLLNEHPNETIDYRVYDRLGMLSKVLDAVMFPMQNFDLHKSITQCSGGEIVKLGLAKLLLHDYDIYLLDEPTNDLDFDTIVFLESFIQKNDHKTIVFISHDERLLENTATSIIHLLRVQKKQTALTYVEKMSYTDYKYHRLKRDEHQTSVVKKSRAEHKKKLERFRSIYQSVSHAQDQAVRNPSEARLLAKKMKQLKAMERRYEKDADSIDVIPELPKPLELFFPDNVLVPKGKTILDFECDTLEIDGCILSKNITLLLKGPEKIVITGKNGCGKTTLLKTIQKHFLKHSDLNVGYMPQSYDLLENYESVLTFLNATHDRPREARVRKMLGAIGFEREEMDVSPAYLSGGQKAKVFLLKMVLEEKEVLILDEPTRNLSPLSAPEIYRLLNDFQGAIICVTHDRAFIEAVFDALYILTEEGLKRGA